MTYTFSKLAQAAWAELGKIQPFHQFLATGGNTTTVINTRIGERDSQPDDNYCIDGTAIVVRDSAGASAAPEGEMQRISAYSGANFTYTVDTAFSSGVAAGDQIAIADPDIPLYEMLRSANLALQELGPFEQKNIALTTVAEQTEYTLPELMRERDILQVDYQGNTVSGDYQWTNIPDYKFIPGLNGAPGIIVIPRRVPADRLLQIVYTGDHPLLTGPTSPVYAYPSLAIAATVAHALQWYNGISSGGTDYWLQRENKAWADLDTQRKLHPIAQQDRATKVLSVSLPTRGGG